MEPTEQDKQSYYKQLTEQEKLILHIATTQLGSSFDLVRSNGFIELFYKQPSRTSSTPRS